MSRKHRAGPGPRSAAATSNTAADDPRLVVVQGGSYQSNHALVDAKMAGSGPADADWIAGLVEVQPGDRLDPDDLHPAMLTSLAANRIAVPADEALDTSKALIALYGPYDPETGLGVKRLDGYDYREPLPADCRLLTPDPTGKTVLRATGEVLHHPDGTSWFVFEQYVPEIPSVPAVYGDREDPVTGEVTRIEIAPAQPYIPERIVARGPVGDEVCADSWRERMADDDQDQVLDVAGDDDEAGIEPPGEADADDAASVELTDRQFEDLPDNDQEGESE